MRKTLSYLLTPLLVSAVFILQNFAYAAEDTQTAKKWTILVFLNGHNNLDGYGERDMNEMEKIGSTSDVNVVVQWASSDYGKTRRVLVKKDNDPNKVTSPVVEQLSQVDMGDWHNLVEFVRWGVEHYPAKQYFIDVWDHGSGWHLKQNMRPKDISFDEETGNSITTKQLGYAMRDIAKIIGHKVDVYGSDACLMAMAEVADEMIDSVKIFLGSEETEPAKGWPYDGFLKAFTAKRDATPEDLAKILTAEYIKSYQGGSQGKSEVTFSAIDLEKMERVNGAIRDLGIKLMTLNEKDRKSVRYAISDVQSFAYSDYGDLMDFLSLLERAGIPSIGSDDLNPVREAFNEMLVINQTSPGYSRAKGLAFWLPSDFTSFQNYYGRYSELRFQADTAWGDVLRYILK